MKLLKENYTKSTLNGGDTILHTYKCNDNEFHVRISGVGESRKVFVYKNDEFDQNNVVFSTSDNLEAWNRFEELVDECSPSQSSSGGFKNGGAQQNPNLLPLFAIKKVSKGAYAVDFFVLLDSGEQISVQEFIIDSGSKSLDFDKVKPFIQDWSDFDVPDVFKCEIFFKMLEDVKFEKDSTFDVFMFIPKSMVNQGGDEGGGEPVSEENGDPQEQEGESQQGQKGKGKKLDKQGQEEDGEGEGMGEGDDGEGEQGEAQQEQKGKGKKGQEKNGESDGEGEDGEEGDGEGDGDGDGEQTDDGGDEDSGKQGRRQEDISGDEGDSKGSAVSTPFSGNQIFTILSASTGSDPSTIQGFFEDVESGEMFLNINDFNKIKKDLNLPQSTSSLEAAKLIKSKI